MERYHHGNLRAELLRLGLKALEREGAGAISLRSLAEAAGVSKTAPYRHFPDREAFLAALADEGYRLLYIELERLAAQDARETVASMGKAYLDFARARPEVYRLMTSPASCGIPRDPEPWARKSLRLLQEALVRSGSADLPPGAQPGVDEAAAAWGYIHGLALLRIDGIFPEDLPQPDWDRLASAVPKLGPGRGTPPIKADRSRRRRA